MLQPLLAASLVHVTSLIRARDKSAVLADRHEQRFCYRAVATIGSVLMLYVDTSVLVALCTNEAKTTGVLK
jgi:hypothetical protein